MGETNKFTSQCGETTALSNDSERQDKTKRPKQLREWSMSTPIKAHVTAESGGDLGILMSKDDGAQQVTYKGKVMCLCIRLAFKLKE